MLKIVTLIQQGIALIVLSLLFMSHSFASTDTELVTCNLNISTSSGSITVEGLNSSHVILKLFNPDWSTNFECFDDCANPLTINGLAEGTYYLSVNMYDSNWSPTCTQAENVTVSGGGGNSCDVSWTTSSGSITINGLNSASHTNFKLFSPSWSTVHSCFDDCDDPLVINGLTNGATYHLSYRLYDSNWQTICQELEDVVIGGGGTPKPDLQLGDMTSPGSGVAGSIVNYTVDVINSGNAVASGSYKISFYLSSNNTYSSDDTWVGEIPTGNTGIGTIQDVPAAITVPSSFAAGNYYLIGRIDSENTIDESNENNNTIAKAISITTSGVGDCGWIKPAGTISTSNGLGFFSFDAATTSTGYQITGTEDRSPLEEVETITINIDENGDHEYNSTEIVNIPAEDNLTFDGQAVLPQLQVTRETPSGATVWTKNITINNTPNNFQAFAIVRGFKIEDGWIIAGNVVNESGAQPPFLQFYVKLDEDGNVLGQSGVTADVGIPDTRIYTSVIETPTGYIVNVRQSGEYSFVGLDNNANFIWYVRHAADTPSTTTGAIELSLDQQYIYAANRDNGKALLTKVNVVTGESVVYNLSALFSQGDFRYVQFWFDIIPTSDGGVVTGYKYIDPSNGSDQEYEYGKVDADGNLVWTNRFNEAWEFQAIAETPDGGYLFLDTSPLTTMKTTADGDITPTCGGGGSGIDIACDLSYTYANGTLTITGDGLNAGHIIIKVFGPSWNTEFQCFDDCGNEITVSGLSDGTYHISIAAYNSSWQSTCNELVDVELGSSNPLEGPETQSTLFFTLAKDGTSARLNWVANNNQLSHHFVVERSVNGLEYAPVSTVEALNGGDFTDYTYVDHQPLSGINFYRIQQVFNDESIRFSQMRQLVFEQDLSRISLFPNPASSAVYLSIPEFERSGATIQIHDPMGQLRHSIQLDAIPEEDLLIHTAGYPSGVYYVTIKLGDQRVVSKKLVVQRL